MTFYSLGRFVGTNKLASAAVLAAVAYVVWAYFFFLSMFSAAPDGAPPKAQARSALVLIPTPPKPDPLVAQCTTGIAEILAKANAAMRKKDPSAAFAMLHDCRNHMTDPAARELLKTSLIASNKEASASADKFAREAKAAKKREGVNLGMSMQDALDSSWGKPRKVNRSTYTFGVHEQWVYDGGYLYFRDGVLTSIQN